MIMINAGLIGSFVFSVKMNSVVQYLSEQGINILKNKGILESTAYIQEGKNDTIVPISISNNWGRITKDKVNADNLTEIEVEKFQGTSMLLLLRTKSEESKMLESERLFLVIDNLRSEHTRTKILDVDGDL